MSGCDEASIEKNRLFNVVQRILKENIARPIGRNLTLTLLLVGSMCILLGGILGEWIDDLPLIPGGTGESILSIGSGILGAGVFAVIVKSAQFVQIFQSHIHEVLYEPVERFGIADLREKWNRLTNKILESTLPAAHRTASERIERQFLNDELAYHFEGYETKYDIVVREDGRSADVLHRIKTKLVVSPNQQNPVFEQDLVVKGDCVLKSLVLDGTPFDVEGVLEADVDTPDKRLFRLPLNNVARLSGGGDREIEVERTYAIVQDLNVEPYFMATIIRYSKGLSVRARIKGPDGCSHRFYFTETGIGSNEKRPDVSPFVDAEGFSCWVLAKPGEVLLPGQGFVLIALPDLPLSCVNEATT